MITKGGTASLEVVVAADGSVATTNHTAAHCKFRNTTISVLVVGWSFGGCSA